MNMVRRYFRALTPFGRAVLAMVLGASFVLGYVIALGV